MASNYNASLNRDMPTNLQGSENEIKIRQTLTRLRELIDSASDKCGDLSSYVSYRKCYSPELVRNTKKHIKIKERYPLYYLAPFIIQI